MKSSSPRAGNTHNCLSCRLPTTCKETRAEVLVRADARLAGKIAARGRYLAGVEELLSLVVVDVTCLPCLRFDFVFILEELVLTFPFESEFVVVVAAVVSLFFP
jgi:hypothetical protein